MSRRSQERGSCPLQLVSKSEAAGRNEGKQKIEGRREESRPDIEKTKGSGERPAGPLGGGEAGPTQQG